MARTVIDQTVFAGQMIVGEHGNPDPGVADLVVRNLAVLTDRIKPNQFDRLPQSTQDQVRDVASLGRAIAEISPADLERLPNETDEQFSYRSEVRQPIQALQAFFHNREMSTDDTLQQGALRYAISESTEAFDSLLSHTYQLPSVNETLGYFQGNAGAASKRIGTLALDNS